MAAKWYKCRECPYGILHESHEGRGYWCSWKGPRSDKQPLVFYGKTAPRTCPFKLLGVQKEDS